MIELTRIEYVLQTAEDFLWAENNHPDYVRVSDERCLHEYVKHTGAKYSLIEEIINYKFSSVITNVSDPDDYSLTDAYPCIPTHPGYFIRLLAQAVGMCKTTDEIQFIDAGCGAGHNLLYAQYVFGYRLKAYGVDYNEFLVKLAKNQVERYGGISDDSIMKGDITTFDFSAYDIIYAYNPMKSTDGMRRFFENVARTARNGAICVFNNVSSGEEAMESMGKFFKPEDPVRGGFLATFTKIDTLI